eukprot:Skav213241  [mRNA]  locus=scaffold2594:65364:71342:- [translate_table: standard]
MGVALPRSRPPISNPSRSGRHAQSRCRPGRPRGRHNDSAAVLIYPLEPTPWPSGTGKPPPSHGALWPRCLLSRSAAIRDFRDGGADRSGPTLAVPLRVMRGKLGFIFWDAENLEYELLVFKATWKLPANLCTQCSGSEANITTPTCSKPCSKLFPAVLFAGHESTKRKCSRGVKTSLQHLEAWV